MRTLLVLVFVASCTLGGPAVPERCQHLGDRCQLQDGLQGVCAVNEAAGCDRPPCLVCTPQH